MTRRKMILGIGFGALLMALGLAGLIQTASGTVNGLWAGMSCATVIAHGVWWIDEMRQQ